MRTYLGASVLAAPPNPDIGGSRFFAKMRFPKGVNATLIGAVMVAVFLATESLPLAVSPNHSDFARTDLGESNARSTSMESCSNCLLRTLPVGSGPSGLAYGGGSWYVADSGSNAVTVVNATTDVMTNVSVGSNPIAVAYDPNGTRAFVANAQSYNLSVIQGQSEISSIAVPGSPVAVTVDGSSNDVFVANLDTNAVTVLNGDTGRILTNISVGDEPEGILFDSVDNQVWVSNSASRDITEINTSSLQAQTSIPVGECPGALALDSSNDLLYVAEFCENAVSVLNLSTGAIDATVAVGNSPQTVEYDPLDGDVYVTNRGSNFVSVLTESREVGEIPLVSSPEGAQLWGLALDPVTGMVAVSVTASNTLDLLSVGEVFPSLAAVSLQPNTETVFYGSSSVLTAAVTCAPGNCPYGVAYSWTESRYDLGTLNSTTESSARFSANSSSGVVTIEVDVSLAGLSFMAFGNVTVVRAQSTAPGFLEVWEIASLTLVASLLTILVVFWIVRMVRGRKDEESEQSTGRESKGTKPSRIEGDSSLTERRP